MHSCGQITPTLSGIAELGFHVLHPVHPECFEDAYRQYADRIVLAFFGLGQCDGPLSELTFSEFID